MNGKQTIAAFDFDNTITTKDSLLPFLIFTHGKWETLKRLLPLTPLFIRYMFGGAGRQETKEAILSSFFKGSSLTALSLKGQEYASSKTMESLLKPAAIARLKWHQLQGHKCYIVSASIDTYLLPWGKRHGFDHVICSRLDVDKNGIFTGKLRELNCWGPEKTRRLLEISGPKDNFKLYAYGDSRGDRELLDLADFPYYCRMPVEGN